VLRAQMHMMQYAPHCLYSWRRYDIHRYIWYVWLWEPGIG